MSRHSKVTLLFVSVKQYYAFLVVISATIFTYKRCVVSFTSGCLYEGSCVNYGSCVCLRIVVSTTYFILFLLGLSSYCVLCTLCCQFPWIAYI